MNYITYTILAAVALMGFSCQKKQKNDDIISQTYVHKYGYAVSQEEWQEKNYPGQVISSLRNGITVTATYENGKLNGPCTFTYPNSHTVEKYILYNQDTPVKEISYDISGMPIQETTQLTENRHCLTTWYTDGVPKSVEEYVKEELVQGQYFTTNHELEAQVIHGNGLRIIRDPQGTLLCKDEIAGGFLAKRESFYASGSPESIAYYVQGKLDGTKKTFSSTGEPLSLESWSNGSLHGLCTYYKNGTKELEIDYLYGKKNGLEIHFLDGETIAHQISWIVDLKHGPETFFLPGGSTKTVWNYDNKEVSLNRFQELTNLDALLSDSSS